MLKAIKSFLKRFLPPPVRAFNREVGRILTAIGNVYNQNSQLLQRQSEYRDQTREMLRAQGELLQRIDQRLKALESLPGVLDEFNREAGERFQAVENHLGELFREIGAVRMELGERNTENTAAWERHIADGATLRDELLQRLDTIEKEARSLSGKMDEERLVLEKTEGQLSDELTQQNSSIERLRREIREFDHYKKVLWNNEFERRVVAENWGDVAETDDFSEKYLKLIAGMDADSVTTVTRILSRQKRYLQEAPKQQDLFTRAEQEELRLLQENFYNDIFRVSDQLYAYKNYLLPKNVFEASVFYYRHGIDTLKTVDRVAGKAIIDVGGYVGDSVLILSELGPDKIYTFEAEPGNFALLQKTVKLNHVSNVVAENLALSDRVGELTLHMAGSGTTAIERPGIHYRGEIRVPVTTLDEYVEEHNIDIGLIKVDIEGGEPGFLAGAKRTICRQKPILLLSIYHNAHDFFELKPLIESWDLGYRFSVYKPIISSTSGETLLIAEVEN